MSGFYDQRANELLGAVNSYSQNLNSITQQNLQAKIANIGGLKQIEATTEQTRAGGKEAQIADQLQEHMNKFADELGLDLSVPGIGKPVLSYASKKAKQWAASRAERLKQARAEQQAREEARDPENIRGTRPERDVAPDEGTELQEFTPTRAPLGGRGQVPEARPTGQVDRPQRETEEAEREPVVGDEEPEAPFTAPPEPDVPPPPPRDAPGGPDAPVEARPPVAERSPAPSQRTARPTQQEDLGPSEPVELDAFTGQPLVRTPPKAPGEDLDTDAIADLPDELGWKNGIATGRGDPLAGPGDFPASEPVNPASAAYNELNRVPQMGTGEMTYSDERMENPFRFQGSEYDPSMLTKGPPASMPEPPNMSFQYQAPTQAEAEAARGIARSDGTSADGLIKPASIEQGRVMPEGAQVGSQDARDQLANALKGGRARPPVEDTINQDDLPDLKTLEGYEPPQPVPPTNVPPEPAGPSVTGGRFADTGQIAPPPPPRDAPGGPDYRPPPEPQPQAAQPPPRESNPLEPTAGEQAETSNVIHQDSDISDAMANESREAADNLASKTASLTADAEDVGKGLFEKATSALGEITGSDVLGGLGSFLGVAGDFLGPIMGGIGLFEAAKGIAESQNEASQDPYASVEKLIAQGQAKMASLDADISSDQFAEKIGGTRAPAFGSLAAPVFSTAGLTGMSQHF